MIAPFVHFASTRIVFGAGVLDQLSRHLDFGRRYLIVTGRASAKSSGALDRLLAQLPPGSACVFSGVSPNPRTTEVDAAVQQGREFGADAVIGMGGGSPLDAAKAAAVGLATGIPLADMLHAGTPAPDHTLPVLAIPTTAGTGSETSRGAILSDEARGIKKGLRGERLLPRLAVVDPSLTWSAPARLSLETGFDIFTHALETWVSGKAGGLTPLLAKEAIARVARWLPVLHADLTNREARAELMFASTLMGINLANSSTCLPHRMQYPVGARTDCTHPAGLAALYPAWCAATAGRAPGPFAAAAALLASKGQADHGRDAADCAAIVSDFLESLGLTLRLRDFGLTEGDLPALVPDVEVVAGTDPGAADPASLLALYEQSF